MALDQGVIGIYADKDLKTALKNIKCPLHHALKPGLQPHEAFMIEPDPNAKNFSKDMIQKFGLRNWRYKKDRFGRRIPNYRNHYQPEISALYAREKIYNPTNGVCVKCRRCIQ
jgi:hypothetical protein